VSNSGKIKCVICKEDKWWWEFHLKKKQKVCGKCEEVSGYCQYVIHMEGSCNKPTDIQKPYLVKEAGPKTSHANIWLCKAHEHSLDNAILYTPA